MEQAKLKEKPFLALNRSYPVAPEKVWRAWTDPEAIKRWWGPNSTPDRVSLVTILFKPVAGGTDLEFLHEQFYDEAARDGHKRGWSESLVKLERFLQESR
jgi:uncharacterized protein YndB with AHSA1/START domain